MPTPYRSIYTPYILVCLFVISCLLNSCGGDTNAKGKYVRQGRKVEIVGENGNYTLLRHGKPYFIKGAGGYAHFEKIKEYGGNSVRVWNTEDAQQILDEAHKYGLTVTLGLRVGREKEGFNYYDKKMVAQQLEELRQVVLRYKDHPALLMWGVGNEVNMEATNAKVWDGVNQIAEMIHEVDPDHPTTTMLIGVNTRTIDLVQRECPAIDVLSFNIFGGLHNIKQKVQQSDWRGPYLISEFGARGDWETYTTWWYAPLEQTSTDKARFIRERYKENIHLAAGGCLGSYIFYWGYRFETTPTWFSLIAETGEETETVDVIRELWSGDTSANKAPYVAYIKLKDTFDYQSLYLKPQREYEAAVYTFDPDGDSLSIKWEVLPDVFAVKNRGKEPKPAPLPNALSKASGNKLHLRTPEKTGPYRLYAYIYDGHGHVATANFPFYVTPDPLW